LKGARGTWESETVNDVWLDNETEKKGKEGGSERGCENDCVMS
jgi:hypothetical protein